MCLNDPPLDRGQRHNGKFAPGQILLVAKGSISRNEYINPIVFGYLYKVTVPEPIPTFVARRDDLMRAQLLAQSVIKVLVK